MENLLIILIVKLDLLENVTFYWTKLTMGIISLDLSWLLSILLDVSPVVSFVKRIGLDPVA